MVAVGNRTVAQVAAPTRRREGVIVFGTSLRGANRLDLVIIWRVLVVGLLVAAVAVVVPIISIVPIIESHIVVLDVSRTHFNLVLIVRNRGHNFTLIIDYRSRPV